MTPQQTPSLSMLMAGGNTDAEKDFFQLGHQSRDEEVAAWEEKFKEMQDYAMEKRQLLLGSVELNAKLNVENVTLRRALQEADEYLSWTTYEDGKPVMLNHIGAGSKIHNNIKNALK